MQEALLRTLGDAWIVQVPYSPEPLWLVPGKPQARQVMRQGIARWSIWTLPELQALLEACGSPVQTLAEAAGALASEPPIEWASA
jgi:hypothetical protein